LSLNSLQKIYGLALCDRAVKCLEKYVERGWVRFVNAQDNQIDTRIFLTVPDGWLFSDEAIGDLYETLT
jgi:hypothetical protein